MFAIFLETYWLFLHIAGEKVRLISKHNAQIRALRVTLLILWMFLVAQRLHS